MIAICRFKAIYLQKRKFGSYIDGINPLVSLRGESTYINLNIIDNHKINQRLKSLIIQLF